MLYEVITPYPGPTAGKSAKQPQSAHADLPLLAANPPDLILLDVVMPDIDGITVCRMLKEDPATRLIPIVIFDSGHNEHGLRLSIKELLELPAHKLHIVLGFVQDKA